MVGKGMFDGLFTGLILIGVAIVLVLWGGWEIIDWLFIDDSIKVSAPLVPEIEITIKNNIADTIYIYRKP